MQYLPKQQPSSHLIPQVGHPPIALWDINHGLELTAAGILVGWRDVMAGVQLCPITQDQVTETVRFSGGRRGLAFNGTTQGIRGWLESPRRANAAIAFHVQLVSASNAATQQSICQLSIDGGTQRLQLDHPATVDYIHCGGSQDATNCSATTGWAADAERVIGAVRHANTRMEIFVNGVSAISGADVSSGTQQNASDLIVGHAANGAPAFFFQGSIRRLAVYNVAHDDAQAVVINAAWRGR